jgi:cation diffusion facilitator family transporter
MNIKNKPQKFYGTPIFLNLVLLVFNLGLFISKIIFALFTNSLALQADAFDSLTDIIMAIASLLGLIYSNKKPNEKFPYGYYKIENIISLIISLFLFYTAYNIIIQAFSEIYLFIIGTVKSILITPSAFTFLLVSLLISIILTLYLKIVGKNTQSPIIQSEASEKFYDIFISIAVIFGFISAYYNIIFIDTILGLLIAVFIIKGGYNLFITSTKTLLDAVIDFESKTELCNLIKKFPMVKDIGKFEIRSYGRYNFLEIDLILNKELHLAQINTLKKLISKEIQSKFPQIFKIIIITQLEQDFAIKIAIPLIENNDLDSEIANHFGEAPFFAFLEIIPEENNRLTGYNIITNKFRNIEKRKGILISEWLTSEKIDKLYLKKELKKGPMLIFEKSLVQVIIIELNTLKEIIDFEIKNQ